MQRDETRGSGYVRPTANRCRCPLKIPKCRVRSPPLFSSHHIERDEAPVHMRYVEGLFIAGEHERYRPIACRRGATPPWCRRHRPARDPRANPRITCGPSPPAAESPAAATEWRRAPAESSTGWDLYQPLDDPRRTELLRALFKTIVLGWVGKASWDSPSDRPSTRCRARVRPTGRRRARSRHSRQPDGA